MSMKGASDQSTPDEVGGTSERKSVRPSGADERRAATLGRGTQLGRYVVLRPLGAGGMGVVYLAYDPELDRKIALKLLFGATSPKKRRWLLQEAQAMAKLADPNVVRIYDTGEHDTMVYLAMEFIDGQTLRAWSTAAPRTWREVLDIAIQAGRGLAAAHDRGLVHRDFKPENVMVATTGEVLVMDFGLARSGRVIESKRSDSDVDDVRSELVLDPKTARRAAGTPAYMAPEQIGTVALTAAVDQFSFCVTVWEALYGQRPFAGSSFAEVLGNAAADRLDTMPKGRRVPRWLRRTLERGLRARREQRWPSMGALLQALERGRGRWRWQLALAGLAVLALPIAGVAAARAEQEAEQAALLARCDSEGAAIGEVWNDVARERLRDGLMATGVRFAERTAETLIPWLDTYRDAWQTGRSSVCRMAEIDRTWDAELFDRSVWCFEDRRLQLEATVAQITDGDARAARRAVRLASYLDPVEACLDPALLDRLPAPPPTLRTEIRKTRSLMTASDKLRHGGLPVEALRVATRARTHAQALEWPPLVASTRFLEGRCMLEAGRSAEAIETLANAYFEGVAAGSWEVAFRAARSLMAAHAALEHFDEAETWGRHARAAVLDKPDPLRLDEAEEHYLRTRIRRGLGDLRGAVATGEQAVALRAVALGADHPVTTAAGRELGRAYLAEDRPEDALVQFEQAYESWRDAVGSEHRLVAILAVYRGEALLSIGRPDGALPWLEGALTTHRKVLGEGHPVIALNLARLGEVYAALGRFDDAERAHTRALALRSKKLGPRHRRTAMSRLALADLDRARGDFDAALRLVAEVEETLQSELEPDDPGIAVAAELAARIHLERGEPRRALVRLLRALTQHERSRDADDPVLIAPLVRLGDAQRAVGDLESARRSYERGLAIAEGSGVVGDPRTVGPWVGRALADLEANLPVVALVSARRAVDLVEELSLGPRRAAPAYFVLARALVATDAAEPEVERAVALARQGFRAQHDAAGQERLDAWVAERAVD